MLIWTTANYCNVTSPRSCCLRCGWILDIIHQAPIGCSRRHSVGVVVLECHRRPFFSHFGSKSLVAQYYGKPQWWLFLRLVLAHLDWMFPKDSFIHWPHWPRATATTPAYDRAHAPLPCWFAVYTSDWLSWSNLLINDWPHSHARLPLATEVSYRAKHMCACEFQNHDRSITCMSWM